MTPTHYFLQDDFGLYARKGRFTFPREVLYCGPLSISDESRLARGSLVHRQKPLCTTSKLSPSHNTHMRTTKACLIELGTSWALQWGCRCHTKTGNSSPPESDESLPVAARNILKRRSRRGWLSLGTTRRRGRRRSTISRDFGDNRCQSRLNVE